MTLTLTLTLSESQNCRRKLILSPFPVGAKVCFDRRAQARPPQLQKKERAVLAMMRDLLANVDREVLSGMSPEEIAEGLDVDSKTYRPTARSLENVLDEQSRREENWVKNGGEPLGAVADFASCSTFVHNLARITVAFIQTEETTSRRKDARAPVDMPLWETSLFIWQNLVPSPKHSDTTKLTIKVQEEEEFVVVLADKRLPLLEV